MAELPVELFQTLKGPVIGHVGKKNSLNVRVWAPAMVVTPQPGKLFFLPVSLCESYLDLFWTTMFGTNPPPDIVVQSYSRYFQEFIKGAYKLTPIEANIGVEGTIITAEDPRLHETESPEPELEACPACQQWLSHWAAHYPVIADGVWICEMDQPTIRDDYPNYNPEVARLALQTEGGGANGTQEC